MEKVLILVALVVTAILAGCGPQAGQPEPTTWSATVTTDAALAVESGNGLMGHCFPIPGGPEGPVVSAGTAVEVLAIQGDALYAQSLIEFTDPTGVKKTGWVNTAHLEFTGARPPTGVSHCGNP